MKRAFLALRTGNRSLRRGRTGGTIDREPAHRDKRFPRLRVEIVEQKDFRDGARIVAAYDRPAAIEDRLFRGVGDTSILHLAKDPVAVSDGKTVAIEDRRCLRRSGRYYCSRNRQNG